MIAGLGRRQVTTGLHGPLSLLDSVRLTRFPALFNLVVAEARIRPPCTLDACFATVSG